MHHFSNLTGAATDITVQSKSSFLMTSISDNEEDRNDYYGLRIPSGTNVPEHLTISKK